MIFLFLTPCLISELKQTQTNKPTVIKAELCCKLARVIQLRVRATKRLSTPE